MSTKSIRIQQKADTTSNWNKYNPQILPKEACFDINQRSIKLGATTSKSYNDLDYFYHPGEEYLTWGGKNTYANQHGPFDAAYIKELYSGINQFAYYPPSQMEIEHSIDGGATWFDAGETDLLKTQLVTDCDSSARYVTHVGDFTNNMFATQGRRATKNDMVRLTFTTTGKPYFRVRKVDIHITYSGYKQSKCKVEGLKTGNKDTENWETLLDNIKIAGSSGHNILNMNHYFGTQNTSCYCKLRFTIYSIDDEDDYVAADYLYCGATAVLGIYAYGVGNWSFISNYNKYGLLYTKDTYKNATFLNGVSVPKYLEIGSGNVLSDGCSQYLVAGFSNKVNGSYGITAGYQHTVSDVEATATIGYKNQNSAQYSIIGGTLNSSSGMSSLTVGNNNNNIAQNSIMGGAYGESESNYLFTLGNGEATRAHNAAAITNEGILLLDFLSIGTIDGIVPSNSGRGICIGPGAIVKNTQSVSIGESASSIWGDVAIGSGADAMGGSVVIGYGAGGSEAANAVNIGFNSEGVGSSVSIGPFTTVTSSEGIAIGLDARSTARQACQIGEGTNSEQSSLQFRDYKLLDSLGKIPTERIPDDLITTINKNRAQVTINSKKLAQLNQSSSVYVEYDGEAASSLLFNEKILLYTFDRNYDQIFVEASLMSAQGIVKNDGVIQNIVSSTATVPSINIQFDGTNVYIANGNKSNSNYSNNDILQITPIASVQTDTFTNITDFSELTFSTPSLENCNKDNCILYIEGCHLSIQSAPTISDFKGRVVYADINNNYLEDEEISSLQFNFDDQYHSFTPYKFYIFSDIENNPFIEENGPSPSRLFFNTYSYRNYYGYVKYTSGGSSNFDDVYKFNQLDDYVQFTYSE